MFLYSDIYFKAANLSTGKHLTKNVLSDAEEHYLNERPKSSGKTIRSFEVFASCCCNTNKFESLHFFNGGIPQRIYELRNCRSPATHTSHSSANSSQTHRLLGFLNKLQPGEHHSHGEFREGISRMHRSVAAGVARPNSVSLLDLSVATATVCRVSIVCVVYPYK